MIWAIATRFLDKCETNLIYGFYALTALFFFMFFPKILADMKKETLFAPPCLLAIIIIFIALVIDIFLGFPGWKLL